MEELGEIAFPLEKGNNSTKLLPRNDNKTMIFREDRGKAVLVPLYPESIGKTKTMRKLTVSEVAQRSTRDEVWIIVNARVYDVTSFVSKHPGGDLVIMAMAGKDCTDAFENYHQARITKNMLPQYLIGEVIDLPVYPHVLDFRAIRQEILRRGMFETSTAFYAKIYAFLVTLFVAALYLSLACSSLWAHMLGACCLGIFWQQLAGLGHDLGHSSVSHSFHTDHFVGSTIGCAFLGVSTAWWKRNHNTHHVACNSVEHDPDIQHMPIMAVDEKVFEKPYWSTYYSKWVQFDSASKLLVGHQQYLFLPLMAVARFNLYAQSWILVCSPSIAMYNRKTEAACLLFFATWVLSVALCMNSWAESVVWVLLSHAVAGILHVQIVISHWAMETYHGRAYNDASDEWYITQLKTTMAISCPKWMDFVHIGLQFQVEHHLFPYVPRHNLRAVQTMVKEVCKKNNLAYHEMSFPQSVCATMKTLKDVSKLASAKDIIKEACSM
jgi:acyl-lipid Delta6-acetylenase / acyl-lipid (9-3)-desaturase